jgi:AcrR family transcriptional regulator
MRPARLRRGRRLAPEARRESLMDVAAGLLLEQGYLPLGVQDLAEAAKVSKALVYKYFPEPPDLYNALLERACAQLADAGVEGAAREEQAPAAVMAAAEVYYRFICEAGPLVQIILRDRFMTGRVGREAAALRDRTCGALARALRREFGLPVRQAVACVSIGMTMPEECGRLAYQGDLDVEQGSALCRELVLGVIDVAGRRGAEMRR